ncbi:glycerate kinase [Enemella sp. A6]|uniref:glycerate kinase n=1 Tax=Enemella sp. A6 TaxID=3440152 RepID=UPI003EBB7A2D
MLICPDSFKGSAPATEVAAHLAGGWRDERPDDDIVEFPLADGGEGTLDAILHAVPGAEEISVPEPVADPLGRPGPGRWVRLGDTALVELADSCGLQQIDRPDARTARDARSDGLATIIRHAWASSVSSLVLAIGGSASTDGGLGVLRGLGLSAIDADRRPLRGGGGDLHRITELDVSALSAPTPVLVLTDVTAPLYGPSGAAQVFGPQKGAGPNTVADLDAGLRHWAGLWTALGRPPELAEQPGAGAAGGIGFGLSAGLGARLSPGAAWLFERTGLARELARADVLITGEGAFDAQSLTGKVVGQVLRMAGPARRWVVAGRADQQVSVDARVLSLSDLAGGPESEMADPRRWLRAAGRQVASEARSGLR